MVFASKLSNVNTPRSASHDGAVGSVSGEPSSLAFGHAGRIADSGITLQC